MERKISEQELDRYRKLSFLARSRPATMEDIYTDSKVILNDKGTWYAMRVVNGESLKSIIEKEPELLDKLRVEAWIKLSHEWMLENGFYDQEYYEYAKAKFKLGYE